LTHPLFADELPVPPFFDPLKVGEVWRVPYQERAVQAAAWARQHAIQPAHKDDFRLSLLLVDVQNTFCIPGFELFVGGRSGMGAVEDNRRLCEFIYRNLSLLTRITATLDTHLAMQIFHPIFLVNDRGEHPGPVTSVSFEDVQRGRWKFNSDLAPSLGIDADYGQRQLEHYVETLKSSAKYDLTIWPYHAMLGGIGHALVSAVEEALFFHTIARNSQADFTIKGDNPLTENYSVLRPEVMDGPEGEPIGHKNDKFIQLLVDSDAVVVAGQAKSHCVSWTVEDLLSDIHSEDVHLAKKVYLLEDCMSPVVVPGVVDYTGPAEDAFHRFAEAGMHLVRTSTPIHQWPGLSPGAD
jgi:nicotinamidase-related amidase